MPQSFSIDYYTKPPISYPRLYKHIITTSFIRDMPRDFSVSADVVLSEIERMARSCVGVQQEPRSMLRRHKDMAENVSETVIIGKSMNWAKKGWW